MTAISVSEINELSKRAQALRSELKIWEKSFAAKNDGRKAGREDIKQDAIIAQKYKEYNRLRTSGSAQSPSTHDTTKQSWSRIESPRKKRRTERSESTGINNDLFRTPQKMKNASQAPLNASHPAAIDPYDSPSYHRYQAATPSRKAIGPTPQKNGYVLGMFDLVSPPMAGKTRFPEGALSQKENQSLPFAVHTLVTPSKKRISDPLALEKVSPKDFNGEKIATEDVASTPARRHWRTPQSSSKRKHFDAFLLTPSSRRFANSTLGILGCTQTPSASNHQSKTAAAAATTKSLEPVKETADEASPEKEEFLSLSPVAVRLPRKPLGRSLSAMVRGLRKMEEEKLDEDLEVLREIENEEDSLQTSGREENKRKIPEVFVHKKQVARVELDLPLGPDGEGENGVEDDEEELVGEASANNKPTKLWKKKGQKRTTRNVRINPNMTKWRPEPEWKVGGSDHEGEPSQKKAETSSQEHKKKTTIKKVAATAHANFRALKIKNKNSKGKRGRFGRRR